MECRYRHRYRYRCRYRSGRDGTGRAVASLSVSTVVVDDDVCVRPARPTSALFLDSPARRVDPPPRLYSPPHPPEDARGLGDGAGPTADGVYNSFKVHAQFNCLKRPNRISPVEGFSEYKTRVCVPVVG